MVYVTKTLSQGLKIANPFVKYFHPKSLILKTSSSRLGTKYRSGRRLQYQVVGYHDAIPN